MKCLACDHVNPEGARFCNSCGSALGTCCSSCQRVNPPSARFCSYCGEPLPQQSELPTVQAAGLPLTGHATPLSRPTPPEFLVGGRYRVKRFLGEGGKKKVYLATDQLLDRDIAFSLVKTDGLDETGIERIKREAQLMGRLGDHPHIVSLYDIGEEHGQPYLVSQLMSGGDVEGLIENAPEHRLPIPDSLKIVEQVCRALEYAHRHGVIHRDLKPGNVWLTSDGTAKLGDFGLAMALDRTRLSMAGMIVGTVAYMPPEQALGRPSDSRSDLYSLGAMLYELVTGRPPFLGDDPVAIISQHINTQPVAPTWHTPELPRPLEQLILSLLAKAPDDRPESASEVREQLEAIRSVLDQRESGSDQNAEVIESRNPLDRLAAGVFVGREKELGHLRASVDAALGGTGQIVLLSGEPGIGKTSLAEEITTYARLRGAQVLWSRNYEWEGAPAYWAWVQMIRAYAHLRDPQRLRSELGTGGGIIANVVSEVRVLLPEVLSAPSFEGEEFRFRLFDAVATFLRAASRNQPLVLVFDDLHWADAPSLLLLQYVARELRDARVLLLGSYRDIEVGRHHPLARTLAELAREQLLERITLRGLTREEIARYIELTAGAPPPPELIDAIVEQTGGNPFFVAEVVRLLVTEGSLERDAGERWSVRLPQGVREVVGRRLDRLSQACNELLAVAAVIGRDFELRLLAAVVEQPMEQVLETLEEALAARVIRESDQPDQYRFNQELIQEVLYEELSIAQRRRLNGAVARALEATHAGNLAPHFAQLAHHYATAGPGDDARKAVDYAIKAAERAIAQAAWETAERQYEQALQMIDAQERPDPELLCQTLLALGSTRNVMSSTGDVPEAREVFLRAAELARQTRDHQSFARAALGHAGVNHGETYGGEVQIDLLEEARHLLDREDTNLRALVLARLALDRRMYYDDYDTAVALSDEAVAIAERLGDVETVATTRSQRFIARWHREHPADYQEDLRRYVDVAERTGRPAHLSRAIRWTMVHRLLSGDVGESRAMFAEFEHWLARIGEETLNPWETHVVGRIRVMWALIDGRLTNADERIRRLDKRMPGEDSFYWIQTAQLRYEQARPGEMLDLVDRLPPRLQQGAAYVDSYLLRAARLTSWMDSDRQRLEAEFQALGTQGFSDIPNEPGWFEIMAQLTEVCVELDDRQHAETLYELLLPHRDLIFVYTYADMCWAAAEHYLGLLATVLERWSHGQDHFQRALEIHGSGGMRLWYTHTQYAYADMLIKRGKPEDRERALELIDQALAAAEDMGAIRIARRSLALKVQVQGILKA
jgi:eukaryotic-like serine/threonine-protein kinase